VGSKLDREVGIEYTREIAEPVKTAADKVTQELAKRGFGVLSYIDVTKIVLEKLGEKMEDYVILDVCSPKQAKRAIDAHKEVGLILPCKIVIYRNNMSTQVSLYRPTKAIEVLNFSDLRPLAQEVERELKQTVDAIAQRE
jgi:uncharacterized protein (DUF302 family)